MRRIALISTLLLLSVQTLSAQEWTRFRGPNGTGVGKPVPLPNAITEKNYCWKVALPGAGHSSPVLWGNRLFLTSADEQQGKRYLLCLDSTTGKTLWKQDWSFSSYHRHEFNSFASGSPTVDAQNVYIVWGTPETVTLYALTHSGKEVWKRNLGGVRLQHGVGNSPIVVDDVVITCVDQEGEGAEGHIYGLDKKTGDIRWQYARKPSAGAPYATPTVHQTKEGQTEVLFPSSSNGFTSLDPKTGSRHWEIANLFPLRCASSPLLFEGLVLATCGSGGGDKSAVAVRLPSQGSSRTAEVAYRIPRGVSYVPTPIAHEGRLYFWCDNGIVACYEAATGKELWRERAGGDYFGSPVLSNGRIYAISTRGQLVTLSAGTSFRVLDRHDLGEASHATPSLANGMLFVRTESHLIAIGK